MKVLSLSALYSKLGPSVGAFIFWAVAGVLGALFSKGSFGVWLMMECSFAGVLCFLSGISIEENEGSMKYYVFQVLGSLFLFLSLVNICSTSMVTSLYMGYFFFFFGFCIKLGLFPFHFWVPAVMGLSSWGGCFIISWLQKIAPLWMLSLCGVPFAYSAGFEVSILGSVLVGSIAGVGILQYRNLLGYSSLVHSGWLVALTLCSQVGFLWYLGMYGVVLSILIYKVNWYGLDSWQDHTNLFMEGGTFSWDNELVKIGIFFDWASLAGFPPLLGSVGKILGVYFIYYMYPLVSIILVLSSMVTFIFYFSMMVNAIISTGKGIWLLGWSGVSLSRSFSGLVHMLSWMLSVFGGLILFVLTGISE